MHMVALVTQSTFSTITYTLGSLEPITQGTTSWRLAALLAGPNTIRETDHRVTRAGLELPDPRKARLRTERTPELPTVGLIELPANVGQDRPDPLMHQGGSGINDIERLNLNSNWGGGGLRSTLGQLVRHLISTGDSDILSYSNVGFYIQVRVAFLRHDFTFPPALEGFLHTGAPAHERALGIRGETTRPAIKDKLTISPEEDWASGGLEGPHQGR